MTDLIISWGIVLSIGAFIDGYMGKEKYSMTPFRQKWMDSWLVMFSLIVIITHYFPSEYVGWEYLIRSGLTGFGMSVVWDMQYGLVNNGNIFAPAPKWFNFPLWKVKIVSKTQMAMLHLFRIIILIGLLIC